MRHTKDKEHLKSVEGKISDLIPLLMKQAETDDKAREMLAKHKLVSLAELASLPKKQPQVVIPPIGLKQQQVSLDHFGDDMNGSLSSDGINEDPLGIPASMSKTFDIS